MIPNSESPKPLENNEKQQVEKGIYTPVYTSDSELQEIVNSWCDLSQEVKHVILYLVRNNYN